MVNTRIPRTTLIILALLISVSAGCTDSSIPDGVLVETYADVIMARQTYGDSTQVKAAVDSILDDHGYNAESFDSDLRSMASSPELFKAFYDSVSFELKRRRDSLRP